MIIADLIRTLRNKIGSMPRRTAIVRTGFTVLILMCAGLGIFALAPGASAAENACAKCHEQKLSDSVHKDNSCNDCHADIEFISDAVIHGGKKSKPKCSECHPEETRDLDKGLHANQSGLFEKIKPTCQKCHGSHDIKKALDPRSMVMMNIKQDLQGSVHKNVACESCHIQIIPGKERPKPQCKNCHAAAFNQYKNSVHGTVTESGSDKDAAMCYDCHGSHQILKAKDPLSRVNMFNLPRTCAKCHGNEKFVKGHNIAQPNAAQNFIDSMHGRALLKRGLSVAPTCNDCHGVHEIKNHKDPSSPINSRNVPDTCGKCHKGIDAVYMTSIHGQILAKGDSRGPICTTCHTAHAIQNIDDRLFKTKSDEMCGKCHKDRLARYRETYHGKAIALGQGKVAACFDCHGTHDIFPRTDQRSHLFRGKTVTGLYQDNLIATCQKCHPNATENFAGYYTHADHTDSKNYPVLYWMYIFMTALLLGVFGFFGVHTLFWLARSIYFYIKYPKEFKESKIKIQKDDEFYIRFKPVERFIHGLVIFSFLLLVLTGMPLKFYDTGWGKILFKMLGGADAARSLHRIGAVITIGYFVLHVVIVWINLWKMWMETRDSKTGKLKFMSLIDILLGPDSPIPNRRDVSDFIAHQKFFFGKGPRPQFERWTYWEKFDYWAVFWGVFIIGMSGLVMWIPETFTHLLPGWIINVALVIHSDEALLAAGFIFTFHFFNVHFRPEKFPIDSVIFSGRISRAELEHERKDYLDRIQRDGLAQKLRLTDEWDSWKKIIHPIGYLAFGIGVVLIILIYFAMAVRLLG